MDEGGSANNNDEVVTGESASASASASSSSLSSAAVSDVADAAETVAAIQTKRHVLSIAGSPRRKIRNADLTDVVALLSIFSQPGMTTNTNNTMRDDDRCGGIGSVSNVHDIAFDHSTLIDDRSGRVIQAYVGCEATTLWTKTRELAHLQLLHTLTLDKCGSDTLVRDLGMLGNLSRLTLRSCTLGAIEIFLGGVCYRLFQTKSSSSSSSSSSSNSSNSDAVHECRFRTTLKDLTIRDCGLTETHLGFLLLDVTPQLPALTDLDVYDNNIRSFRSVSDRIASSSSSSLSSSSSSSSSNLRTLRFANNPVDRWYRNPTEAAALRTIAGTLTRLSYVTNLERQRQQQPRATTTNQESPSLEYTLRLRHAGRELLDGSGGGRATPVLPPSAWPRVLERAAGWNRFANYRDGNPTGVYYLLRCGPALHF